MYVFYNEIISYIGNIRPVLDSSSRNLSADCLDVKVDECMSEDA